MIRAAAAWGILCALAAAAGAAPRLALGPWVQAATPDGFVVVFETDEETAAEVRVGEVAVTTRGRHHEARLTGLAPGKRHRYEVRLGGEVAAAATTATAPAEERPFLFVVYGDGRAAAPAFERRVAERILAEAPELVVSTGDIVAAGGDEKLWRRFFAAEQPLLEAVPVYLSVGNHELHGDPGGAHVRRFFVPPGGPAARDRRFYSFEYAGSRFVVLDGNQQIAEQAVWLEKELGRPGARHVFVFVHQPPLSTGGHCGAGLAQAAWVAAFEKHRPSAVFGGHDHAYQHLERHGVRYFVTGGAGAPVYPARDGCTAADHAAQRRYADEHHYLRVRVDGDRVEVTAVRLDPAAPPIEVVAFARGEPASLAAAPPLGVQPMSRTRLHRLGWLGAFGAVFLVAMLRLRLRRPRRA